MIESRLIIPRFIRFRRVCFYMHTTQQTNVNDRRFCPYTGFRASVCHLMLRGFQVDTVFSSDSFLRHLKKSAGLGVVLRGEKRE